jgi:glycosyltransferase involved in cell wall biosynthesis
VTEAGGRGILPRMRIIHSLEGKTWSGGQQQALFLAHAQHRLGHEVLLLCQTGSELAERAGAAGVPTAPHDYRAELHPLSIAGLLRAYDSFRPDVVNVHRAWAHTQWLIVSLLRRFEGLIVTRRVLFRPDPNPVSYAKYRTSVVRGYIAVSSAVAGRLRSVGVPARRIRVVHSATDTHRFAPEQVAGPPADWPVPAACPAALLVANFHPNKGHFLVLDAMTGASAAWPDLHLVIAGTGTDGPELRARLAGHPARDRIHLLGFRADVPELLAGSRFSVNASYEEGFSGTARDSLAMGVPVVAADIPANRELHTIVPMRLFSGGSAPALAEAMAAERLRDETPETMTERRALVERAFSVAAMNDQTLACYRAFLAGRLP